MDKEAPHMEQETSPPPSRSETHIHDLPDECLTEILRRIGWNDDNPLPIHTDAHMAPKNVPVTHPLQCAFVCTHWRTLTAASVQSLSLHLDHISFSRCHMDVPFLNLTTLALSWHLSPCLPVETVEQLAPQLETLDLRSCICGSDVQPMVLFIDSCRNLRSLAAWLHPSDVSEEQTLELLDSVCQLPLLAKLTLCYGGPHSAALWARLNTIPTLREIHLTSNTIPPTSATRCLQSLRSFQWNGDGASEDPSSSSSPSRLADDELTRLVGLESLTVRGATSMATLPECAGRLSRLTWLELCRVDRLLSLPDMISNLPDLQVLNVTECWAFQRLPESVGALRRLRILKLDRCRELPASLGQLTNLRVLHAKGELQTIPEGIGRLAHLRCLRLGCCTTLHRLPECLGDLATLEELELAGCPVTTLPERLSLLTRLKTSKLSLPAIEALPENLFGNWCALTGLEMKCPAISRLPDSFCELHNLTTLTLNRCYRLRSLPDGFGGLNALRDLVFMRCWSLGTLPSTFGRLRGLEGLTFFNCGLLKFPASMGELSTLVFLNLTRCGGLEKLPSALVRLPRLEYLKCPFSLLPADMDLRVWDDPDNCFDVNSSDSDDDSDFDIEEGLDWS